MPISKAASRALRRDEKVIAVDVCPVLTRDEVVEERVVEAINLDDVVDRVVRGNSRALGLTVNLWLGVVAPRLAHSASPGRRGQLSGHFSPPTSPLDSPLSTLVRTRVGGSVTYQSHRLRHERGISGVNA